MGIHKLLVDIPVYEAIRVDEPYLYETKKVLTAGTTVTFGEPELFYLEKRNCAVDAMLITEMVGIADRHYYVLLEDIEPEPEVTVSSSARRVVH